MSFEISGVSALEILDSRGRPTVQTTVTLSDGTTAAAGVPSGASTGTREAVELRDGDTTRFGGSGVLTAVGNVNGEIADLLKGRSWESLSSVDEAMVGAPSGLIMNSWKSRALGACAPPLRTLKHGTGIRGG